jgi:SAM-dependent methyltransferase
MIDYTGPHDYFDESYVRQWERVANSRRPFRVQFFDAFAAEINLLSNPKVLDLGSGPGFLAEQILSRCEVASYHLFDFSPHMISLSRARLAPFGERVRFHQGSFLDRGWWQSLPGPFDAVVSLQAVHELRDASRIAQLYSELRPLLAEGGAVLIADQVNSDTRKEEHLLTVDEHKAALGGAGFEDVRQVCAAGDLAMVAGRLREKSAPDSK